MLLSNIGNYLLLENPRRLNLQCTQFLNSEWNINIGGCVSGDCLGNEGNFQWTKFSFNLGGCRQPNNNIPIVLLGGI
jgi:hypothetical protein